MLEAKRKELTRLNTAYKSTLKNAKVGGCRRGLGYDGFSLGVFGHGDGDWAWRGTRLVGRGCVYGLSALWVERTRRWGFASLGLPPPMPHPTSLLYLYLVRCPRHDCPFICNAHTHKHASCALQQASKHAHMRTHEPLHGHACRLS